MRLLLHDTLVTAPMVLPLHQQWVEPAIPWEARDRILVADLGPDDIALLPSAEITLLSDSHQIVPEIAVVAEMVSAVALRTPVRPDEVERTVVRLWHVSGTAELLVRATLEPFFGIHATGWSADDTAEAEAVVVEGAAALQPVEAGFAEDLGRAWFILTGLPLVSHLLVAPVDSPPVDWQPAVAALHQALAAAEERGKELRRTVAAAVGDLDRDRLVALYAGQHYALTPNDRQALLALLRRGSRGSVYPAVPKLRYAESESSA